MDTSRLNFQDWPLDLLVDYALKVHHRTIRREGPATLALVEKVVGENEVMPADASADYRTLLARLEEFMEALKEHIHVENDIIFPGFLEVEQRVVTHGYRF